ncbi:hypothetical protein OH76DRAFT_1480540 [Lentinus brumalis]|uniref:F-box domain-containing protein n=1 Tax=Lentinus brumalis TaxID=2498619 RepID=A0A371DIP4_9APHY|nr:hypothetical protein OH76DRAFT_1480540 [Polyporus brumalis]
MSQPLLRHFGPRQNLRGRHFHNLTKRIAVAGPVAPAERVLASDDLAPLVWAHFQQPKYTPQERNEIINYMLINSTCWRTAAHLLWGNLEDILKLLDLLDLHKWEHPKINRQLRGQAYLNYITAWGPLIRGSQQFERFVLYSEAVLSVNISSVTVVPGVFALISSWFVDSTMSPFPSLRQLDWSEATADNDDMLHLLAPSLRALVIRTFDFPDAHDSTEVFQQWLSRVCVKVATVCPEIKSLGLEAATKLTLPPATLRYFRSLDRLDVVRVNIDTGEHYPAPQSISCLTELRLRAFEGSSALFECLEQICPFMINLRIIELQSWSHRYYPDGPDFIHHIEALRDMPQLEVVLLHFVNHEFRFNDHHLLTLVMSWPRLRQLALTFQIEPKTPVPTIQTLGRVATVCPELRAISLPRLMGIPACDKTPLSIIAPHNHPLNEIRIQHLDGDDSVRRGAEISNVLSAAFPKLLAYYVDKGFQESQNAVLSPFLLRARVTFLDTMNQQAPYLYC